jgi:hypothetical protein
MNGSRGAALVVAAAASVVLITSAGAAVNSGAKAGAARFDLSTRTGVVRYLSALGLDSRGFVIQRGRRNYAGPRCPGQGWNCTRSSRVVQVAKQAGAVNRFEYKARGTAASPCGAVQSNPGGNIAKVSLTAGPSQSCTITQMSGTGNNSVQLSEAINQASGTSQTASQDAQISQTSETGSNDARLSQQITQSISESGTAVNESQIGEQTFTVKQTVNQSTPTVGTNTSRVDESLTQTATAVNATSGSQYQRARLVGHVDQFSHALSTSQNNQTEKQTETAAPGSAVLQTEVGPSWCCTSQTDNLGDVFKARQTLTQATNSAHPALTEDAQIDLATSGTATGNQTVTENGQTTSNSSTGGTVNLGTTCTQGTCTPTQNGYPSGDVFVSYVDPITGIGKVQERKPDGTLVQTLDTGHAGFAYGMAFDAAGNLYVTDFSVSAPAVTRFTPSGGVSSFGSGYSADPESIVFDAVGNAYVGHADGAPHLLKFNSTGTPAAAFDPASEARGTDWIDLAPDQCTIYYTSEGTRVKTFDVCANAQGPDFATGLPGSNAYTLRLLPGGGALVADTAVIVRLDASGQVAQSYDSPGEDLWYGLTLDPDGKSFWATDFNTGDVIQFDITTGAVTHSFNAGVTAPNMGAVVVAP